MRNRLLLARLTTGLLYFGPLLAGLVGQGWAMVPVFLAIFLLSSVILQPDLWPRSQGDLARSEAAVALASLVATQALLVVICFALGRGIGGVLALQPALPVYLPVALSFASVPLARLVWRPEGPVVGFDPVPSAGPNTPGTAVEAMLTHLLGLGEDVSEDVLQRHLSAIMAHSDPVVLRQALGQQATAVKALIVHATDPATSALLAGTGYPAQAFAAAGLNADHLALFARRCLLALEDEPDLAADCPTPTDLRRVADAVGDAHTAAALHRLAGFLDAMTVPLPPGLR